MKKSIAILLIVSLCLIGCGQSMTINNVERKPVGLISMNVSSNLITSNYSKDIQYEICWGNVIWGIILSETIIVPIYFFGFSMFNPIGELNK